MTDTTTSGGSSRKAGHTAGLLDIRNIIGSLLAIDGLILLLAGLFADTEEEKTGGVNANLWAGIVLLVVGVIFVVWARVRPVVVPDDFEAEHDEGRPAGH